MKLRYGHAQPSHVVRISPILTIGALKKNNENRAEAESKVSRKQRQRNQKLLSPLKLGTSWQVRRVHKNHRTSSVPRVKCPNIIFCIKSRSYNFDDVLFDCNIFLGLKNV